MKPRPFYIIAHRCNDVDKAIKKIKAGANAVEIDIQHKNSKFYVDHDIAWGMQLPDYLDSLCTKLLSEKNLDQFSLLIFDIKDTDFDINILIQIFNDRLADKIKGINAIFSTSKYKNKSFFNNASLSINEGLAIDESNEVNKVEAYFKEKNISNFCYGNGIFVAGIAPNLFETIKKAIQLATSNIDSFKMVYVWTLGKQSSMRKYIDIGVDGIFVNDVEALYEVIQESKYRDTIYLPGRQYTPFDTKRI